MIPLLGRRSIQLTFIAPVLAAGVGGCTSLPPAAFQDGRPIFEPEKFFSGHTRSWGVFETPAGEPTQRLTTETLGHWEDDTLHIEQDLIFEKGKRQHRSWRLHRLDAHHYEATGNDIVGTARGLAYGNCFHWHFTIEDASGNPLGRLGMSQWMYLQPDGRTLINRDTITKAGVIVAQVTEQFRKLDH